ncbi:undecaprenyldiphospho-muramoylpentapeptide beta-N-acetylglucosaminyltransferase [Nocardia camponoti]|uniref:UDP-N-acetylglucosamine--N-acetylmuramyl-(pentapeptide) pyrophosphoryl-undecaprenol N-acetylglucosamine transferase n=1 Tax=Nocardia camponoti TaxID=1616106 RepID=A0A917QSQ5_9NOCA|nr:UDP-N-acetylglucosamine--N-acetylmuramyl-(pentapeptide) pyrophosphoryl-undecaprenol N-acetylglucosamine transferase [Nocardia camponoti]
MSHPKSERNGLSVIVAGGGTAGHIEPALAVADALRALDDSIQVTALGTERGLETKLVPDRGYPLALIPPVPLPRKLSADLLRLPAKVRASVKATRKVIDDTDADVIIGFGGYVSLPAYLAARGGVFGRKRRVPVVVHEANAKAGIANKVGARLAAKVLAAVPDSGLPDAQIVGIPVRASITGLDRAGLRAEARAHFGLPAEGPVLLVTGGSQGARSLNEAVSGAATQLVSAGVSVLHAHGPKNTVELDPGVNDGTAKYIAVPYLSRMDLAYAAADATVCRSGAMTVAEVSAVGLPAFYVPLPHGNGEQEFNARPVVSQGGGTIVADADLTPKYVIDEVIPLLLDPPRLDKMSRAAAGAGHRDAANTVARIVVETAR